MEERLQDLINCRLEIIKNSRLKISVGGKEAVVKDQPSKVVQAILSAKDFIGTAVSPNPKPTGFLSMGRRPSHTSCDYPPNNAPCVCRC